MRFSFNTPVPRSFHEWSLAIVYSFARVAATVSSSSSPVVSSASGFWIARLRTTMSSASGGVGKKGRGDVSCVGENDEAGDADSRDECER